LEREEKNPSFEVDLLSEKKEIAFREENPQIGQAQSIFYLETNK
jgi:hypothetical protein